MFEKRKLPKSIETGLGNSFVASCFITFILQEKTVLLHGIFLQRKVFTIYAIVLEARKLDVVKRESCFFFNL